MYTVVSQVNAQGAHPKLIVFAILGTYLVYWVFITSILKSKMNVDKARSQSHHYIWLFLLASALVSYPDPNKSRKGLVKKVALPCLHAQNCTGPVRLKKGVT